jgi:hypothetical protein
MSRTDLIERIAVALNADLKAERLAALEAAGARTLARAKPAVSTTSFVGATLRREAPLEYEIVPLPESGYLGNGSLGRGGHRLRLVRNGYVR